MPRPLPKKRRFQRDMSAEVEEHRFVVGSPDEGARLDAFLSSKLAWCSRARLRQMIEHGKVSVSVVEGGDPDRRRVRPSLRLHRLQEVLLVLDAAPRLGASERQEVISIVYQDADLLVVNKPPGVSVYPNPQHPSGSLVERVHRTYVEVRDAAQADGLSSGADADGWMPSPCHRLDRDTSGLVVFARNPEARAELGRQFEERSLEKTYLAAVVGHTEEREGNIDAPLGPAPGSDVELRMAVRSDGQPALTLWRSVARFEELSLLELRPRTGRQHQLRAHLASIGHPIVGDKLYLGGNEVFLRSLRGELTAGELEMLRSSRQALHALRLTFLHPSSGDRISLHAPLWPDILDLLVSAGGRAIR